MANPRLPGIPPDQTESLYAQLQAYNRGRASFKEVGAYLVVLPRPDHPNYTLWIYVPLPDRQVAYHVCELCQQALEALRRASSLCLYSKRPMYIVDYNAKRMVCHGDDLIFFGKYRGHYLHEILSIDPSYLNWIACKFEARQPKQKRFTEIARIYSSVYEDIQLRRQAQRKQSRFLGKEGETVSRLHLTVTSIRVEDNPYRTKVIDCTPRYYVRQLVRLKDADGNLVSIKVNARTASLESGQVPAAEHAFRAGEHVYVGKARVTSNFRANGLCCTGLGYLSDLYVYS